MTRSITTTKTIPVFYWCAANSADQEQRSVAWTFPHLHDLRVHISQLSNTIDENSNQPVTMTCRVPARVRHPHIRIEKVEVPQEAHPNAV